MQRLNFQLRLTLELDKSHRRPRRCLRNRLGISLVVFLRLHIGSHVFWRHQPHPMPLLGDALARLSAQRNTLAARLLAAYSGMRESLIPVIVRLSEGLDDLLDLYELQARLWDGMTVGRLCQFCRECASGRNHLLERLTQYVCVF